MIAEIEVKKSYGGRSSNNTWVNKYFVRANFLLKSAEFRAIATHIANAEKSMHHEQVHFLQVKLSPKSDNLFNNNEERHVTIPLTGNGERTPKLNLVTTKVAPLDLCMVVNREVEEGRVGKILYRGAIGENEFTVNADRKFNLSFPEDVVDPAFEWGGALPRLNAALPHGAVHVMPDPPGLTLQTSRLIMDFSLAGLEIRKRERERTTIAQAQKNVYQREINKIWNSAYRKIQDIPNWLELPAAAAVVAAAVVAINAVVAAAGPTAALSLSAPASLKALQAAGKLGANTVKLL